MFFILNLLLNQPHILGVDAPARSQCVEGLCHCLYQREVGIVATEAHHGHVKGAHHVTRPCTGWWEGGADTVRAWEAEGPRVGEGMDPSASPPPSATWRADRACCAA